MSQVFATPMPPGTRIAAYSFGADFDPTVRLTFTIEDGKATKVRLLQGGATIEGQRRP